MSEESVDARPLTSASSSWMLRSGVRSGQRKRSPLRPFSTPLSRLVGRWLLVRSDAPEMDAVTVLCKARGYIARQEVEWRR